MKQTAVEWYFDKMKSHFEHDGDLYEVACMTYAIAKEKEKEQILSFAKLYDDDLSKGKIRSREDLYKETYKQD
jgi:ribosome maturation protein Sdo1